MSKSPASILFDQNGNPVGVVLEGATYRLQVDASLSQGHGLATDTTLSGVETILTSIRDTTGIKQITDPVSVTDNGGSLTVDGPLTDSELRASPVPTSTTSLPLPIGAATEATLSAVDATASGIESTLTSIDGKDFATETTLATLATESKLEAVRVLLNSLDGKDFSTETTLSSLRTDFNNEDFATQATLSAVDTKLGVIDGVLDSIKDTDGIKKITDQLPAGTNEIGSVKQGTKAVTSAAWPFVLVDSAGNYATITLDAGVRRQEVIGKVQVVGATPPPSTTATEIFADTPLTVDSHDTTYIIPNGETFYLQNVTAGNEDPTKGSVITVLFDDGTEHVVARLYTNGTTVSIGYTDLSIARDGTLLTGTNTIIVRREKFSGTNIAIDAVVTGYTV